MRTYSFILFLLLCFRCVVSQETLLTSEQLNDLEENAQEFKYESDISRLMRVVVQHLYHDRDVFLRELISNSNDAIEKARLMSLKDSNALSAAPELNISIIVDPENERIVIRDSGVGMTKDELAHNLGTIARSGTSEFLNNIESGGGNNFIGQFGLGFYSSFLVADKVTVASKALNAEDDTQYVFESAANADAFRIAPDPRGNTLGRGTEITLYLREDAKEYLDNKKIKDIIATHSKYGHAQIYLYEPDASEVPEPGETGEADETDEKEEGTVSPWKHINRVPPLWLRDPADITDEEYKLFYKKTFLAYEDPVAWTHFKGEAGSTTFSALVYIPQTLPNEYFTKSYLSLEALKLFVRRVFITSDLGENYIPKYLDFIKVFIDADDLPLNVGRDSLQKSKAIHQIQTSIIRKTYELLGQFSKASPNKYIEWYNTNKGSIGLKMGVLEDSKNKQRIVKLLRFETSTSDPNAEAPELDDEGEPLGLTAQNYTSLDDYVLRRKQGQKQIYFLASIGISRDMFLASPFIEKLLARGYEVLFFNDPLDEALVSSLVTYEGLRFQDVAKKGLKFGDEDEDAADREKEVLEAEYAPLKTYLLERLGESINEVALSNRLTESPCLIITDAFSWTANMERLMQAQSQGKDEFLTQFMRTQKRTFEINPKHPLVESLLDKVVNPVLDDEGENDLDELTDILWQTALIRSGFGVPDANKFFVQIESLLRRYLGISKSARATPEPIKPAPPIDTTPLRSDAESLEDLDEANVPVMTGAEDPSNWDNWAAIKERKAAEAAKAAKAAEETTQADDQVSHDEL